jgi:hypothetical protein
MYMKYDLAKELMDAGFPQGGNGTWKYQPDAIVARHADRAYAPTIEELMEAFGVRMYSLVKKQHGFVAFSTSDAEDVMDMQRGDTPDEALARLWLALNKYDGN